MKHSSNRDLAIHDARQRGGTYAAIGRRFALAPSTIAQILKAVERRKGYVNVVQKDLKKPARKRRVDMVDFSTRVACLLKHLNVKTIGDLEKITGSELLRGRNFSHKSLAELNTVLRQHGVSLKGGKCPTCGHEL